MGSRYEGKKVMGCREEERIEKANMKPKVKVEEDESEWIHNVEEHCGFLGEKTIREVMTKTGLMEEDDKELLGKVEVEPRPPPPPPPEDKLQDEKKINVGQWPPCSWAAFEEEPPMGWIWYPYTDEELMSFEEEEVVWEHSLWIWKDINGIGIPTTP